MTTRTDPDGQSDISHGNVFGLKQYLLFELEKLKRQIANAERLLHEQEVIINDATRAAVLRELAAEIHKQAGNYEYEAGYEEMKDKINAVRLRDEASRLENWAHYLETYGWSAKYFENGNKKLPTLEDKIDRAYIQGGAKSVMELMAK